MATLTRVVLAIVVAAPFVAAQEVQPKFVLSGHRGSVFAVAFSPDSKRLASTGYSDGTLRFWDTTTGKAAKVKRFPKRTDTRYLAFMPDGKALAMSFSFPVPRTFPNHGFEAVEILDLVTGAKQDILKVEDPDALWDLRLTPDGRTLAMVTVARGKERNDRRDEPNWEGRIYLWDVGTKKMKARIISREFPHNGWRNGHGFQFSPDGSTLASASDSGHDILLFETTTWKVRATLSSSFALSGGG